MLTVRRKLMIGVVLVLAMVGTLTLGSLSAIWSYREVVNDWDRNLNRLPRRGDLVEALAALLEPLTDARFSSTVQGRAGRQMLFVERLAEVERQSREAWSKLANLPPSAEYTSTREMAKNALWEIDVSLQKLREEQAALADPVLSDATTARLTLLVAATQAVARSMPELGTGLAGLLASARESYRGSFWWVSVATVLVVVLLSGVVVAGYRWIFRPWAELLEGTSRVAQGKFEYRVRTNTNDEFGDLADSFNRMTDRFLETRDDLDRQVRERSEALMRSERLAGLGFFSAGIAHELNNPLTAIRWTSESLLSRFATLFASATPQDASLVQNYLQMIQSESARCQQITTKLLDFARGGDGLRASHDLTQIVREVLQLVAAMSKYRQCEMVFEHCDPCVLEINGNEIKQVILNLVANALDAIAAGAGAAIRRPRLSAELLRPDTATAVSADALDEVATGRLEIRLTELTDHVELELQDSGCGMSAETLRNIFEPFFTTKASGQGTGLGLAISHRIVTDHAGRLSASSDGPGRGSTFRLSLPRALVQEVAA